MVTSPPYDVFHMILLSQCRTSPHHLQAGKRVSVNAKFYSNLANVTVARPCLLECMRLLCAGQGPAAKW